LLAGYAYADYLIRHRNARQQAIIHTVLALISIALLPIIPAEALKPADAFAPIGKILLLLLVTIGLPYFLLSTTGPLVQAWATKHAPAQQGKAKDGSIYRLYAVSNFFSMLALVSYPFMIEPAISGRHQSIVWSIGYAAFVALVLWCAWKMQAQPIAPDLPMDTQNALSPVANSAASATVSAANTKSASNEDWLRAVPSAKEQGLWLLLAALGSMFLLTITNHITQNVASVPFLWVVPLAIYLISFILCFDGKGWYMRAWYLPLACLLAAAMMGGLRYRLSDSFGIEPGIMHIEQAVPLYCLGLFVLCMFCHGELVARKPAAKFLTRFYLMVSLGGALGGMFVGLFAPVVFNSYYEFPLALILVALLATYLVDGAMKAIAAACVVACALLAVVYGHHIHEDTVHLSRNFYGTLRVKSTGPDTQENTVWRLMHGVILHGEQYRHPKYSALATTYYGESSGVGRAITLTRENLKGTSQALGLVGMGVGTLAAYGRPGDRYTFYELNPEVLDLAKSHFSYLKNSKANVQTVLGDARLSLEKAPASSFDVLAVDAFSSDSIPTHLLTREAIALYKRHMKADGVMAFHISNRYLDLTGVVRQLADSIGWQAIRVTDDPEKESYLYRSDWILVTNNNALVAKLLADKIGVVVEAKGKLSPWTDDYNNLLEILK
jgi:SAM-dependent methyltransferase